MEKYKIFFINEIDITPKLIANLIKENEQLEIVGSASTGQEGILQLDEIEPDIIILGKQIKDGISIEDVIKEILKFDENIKILSINNTAADMDNFMKYREIGAYDFISKPFNKHRVVRTLLDAGESRINDLKNINN